MGKVSIGRRDQLLGEFTEEEVVEGLRSGQFFLMDTWRKEGMEKWEPLASFGNNEAAQSAPPLSKGKSKSRRFVPPVMAGPFPWENERLGFFRRLWQTSVRILFHPQTTFAQMPVTGSYDRPLRYAVIGIAIILAIRTGVELLMMFQQLPSEALHTPYMRGYLVGLVLSIPVGIVLFALVLFVMAGVWHFFLVLFGAGRSGYQATFRGVAYVNGLIQLLSLVPCLGCVVAVWGIVLQIIAFKEAHRTSYWRVICAYFVLLLLCCGCPVAAGLMALNASGELPIYLEHIRNMDWESCAEQIRNAIEQAGVPKG